MTDRATRVSALGRDMQITSHGARTTLHGYFRTKRCIFQMRRGRPVALPASLPNGIGTCPSSSLGRTRRKSERFGRWRLPEGEMTECDMGE